MDGKAAVLDELNQPLGLGPSVAPRASPLRTGVFAAVAAFIVAAAVAAQAAFVLGGAPRTVAPTAEAAPVPPVLAAALPPPVTTPAAPPVEKTLPRSVEVRAGAPAPLIIDVQQALAQMRAQNAAVPR